MKLKPYPKYTASGVEWLCELPEHWRLVPIKHIVKSLAQGWSPQCESFPAEGGAPGVLKVGCVNGGKFRPEENKALPAELDLAPELAIRAGDLLISRANTRELVGSAAVVPTDHPGLMLCDKLYRLRLRKGISSPGFLAAVLGTPFARTYIEAQATGASSSMQNIGQDTILRLPVALPSEKEQEAIVAFLDRETAKIDTLIAKQEKLIELLQEKRQTVISCAVTKGLDPKAPKKPSGVEWLGDVPVAWDSGALRRIATRVVVGIAEAATHAYSNEGIPILRATNVRPGVIVGDILRVSSDFSSERATKTLRAGDLVTVRTGNAGVTALIPAELDGCQCFTMLITTLDEGFDSQFYCYYMNSSLARAYFALEGWGTAQINISVPILQALPIPIPPYREQLEIVAHVNKETAKIDTLIAKAQQAIELQKEHRTALISAAVTGKIDVRDVVDLNVYEEKVA